MQMDKMRRSDRELTKAEFEPILANGEYGVLSTVGEDGYPYGTPVSYVYSDGGIYFHCASDVGHKLKNIAHSAKVCFTVVGETEVMPEKFGTKYESVVVFGLAEEVPGKKQWALEKLIEKYAPAYRETGLRYIRSSIGKTAVYKINIERVSGKACR